MVLNSKQTTVGSVLEQRLRELAEPTKFILRCCEMRKHRMGPSILIPEAQRARVKSGN
jgi:hypothetical protein